MRRNNRHRQTRLRELSHVLRLAQLSSYEGVAQNYLAFAQRSVEAEGAQAISRLKAYKLFAEKRIAERRFSVPKGKYRHLKPIIRMLQMLSDSGRDGDIWAVMTLLRCYECFEAPERQVRKALEDFKSEYMTTRLPRTPFVPETFPMTEFKDYLDAIRPILRRKLRDANGGKLFAPPTEAAIFLAKKGSSRIKPMWRDGRIWDDDREAARPFAIHLPKGWSYGNTLPAIISAVADAVELVFNQYSLRSLYMTLADIEGREHNLHGSDLSIFVDKWLTPDEQFKVSQMFEVQLRRNVALADKGYKVRIIFIGDYWCNYTLYPAHDALMATLRTIPTDFSHDHDQGFRVLNKATATSEWIGCYDLHQATDSFPVGVQFAVAETLWGREFAEAWYQAAVCQPTADGLYYKIGQGMGLPLSWVLFALTHHLIVSFADSRISHYVATPWDYPSDRMTYLIIGDDIAIADFGVASEYARLMSSLGVRINMSKSHIVDHKARLSEFVKRLSLDGTEISGISPGLVLEAQKDVRQLHTLSRLLEDRHDLDPREVSSSFKKFFPDRLRNWITMNESIPSFLGGFLSSGKYLDPEAIMEPTRLKVALITNLKSVTRYAYKGKLVDRKGRVVMDEAAAFAEVLPGPMAAQLTDYQRHHGADYHRKVAALEGSVYSKLTDILDLDDSLEILLSSEELVDWLNHQDLGIEFYQVSEVRKLVQKDYLHKLERNLSLVTDRGWSVSRLAARRFHVEPKSEFRSSAIPILGTAPGGESEAPEVTLAELFGCVEPLSFAERPATPESSPDAGHTHGPRLKRMELF